MTQDVTTLLTFEAAAAQLGVSHRYIDRLAKSGRLEVIRLGRLRRVRQSDVRALSSGRSAQPTEGTAVS